MPHALLKSTDHIQLVNVCHSKSSRSDSGFTLLEVMVATAILAIALTAILSSQSRSLFVADANDFARVSAHLAAGKMEDLMEQTDGRPVSGRFDEPFSGYTWRAEITKQMPYMNDEVSLPSDLVKITLHIADERRGQQLVLSRYRGYHSGADGP